MNGTTLSFKNFVIAAICCILLPLVGYVYVNSFNMGIRIILVVHGLILFFLFFALSLTDLKSSLIITMILVIPMEIDFSLVRYPAPPGYPPFAESIVVDLAQLILAVLMIQWLAAASMKKTHGKPIIGHPIGTLFLVWIFYSLLVGWLKAKNTIYAYFEVVALVQGFLVYFYLINNTNSVRDVRVIIYALFAAQSLEALWLIFQYVTGLNYTIKGVFVVPVRDLVGFRSGGFTGRDVVSTQMISFLAPVVLAYYFIAADRMRRIMAAAIICLFALGIMCAQTRSTGFATIVGFIMILTLGGMRGWISQKRVLKFVSIALVFLILISPLIYSRFQKGAGGWEEDRVPLMRTAEEMWLDNWLLGVGPSNYTTNLEKYLPVEFRYTWKAPVHNEFLMQLAERGIIGAVLYYWFSVIMCIKLWRTTRSPDKWIAAASAGILAGMLGSIIVRMFHWWHQMPNYTFFCVMLALAVAMENIERRRLADSAAVSVS
jgi:O-antigen ligase